MNIMHTSERLDLYPLLNEDASKMIWSDQHAVSQGELVTSGAGPCIVVAALCPGMGKGFLAHMSLASSEANPSQFDIGDPIDPEGMIIDFAERAVMLPHLGPPSRTKVWVGGGGTMYEDEPIIGYEVERKYVLDVLSRIVSPENVTVEWIEEPDATIWAKLDPVADSLTIGSLHTSSGPPLDY